MNLLEITTFSIYFFALLIIVFLLSKKQKSDTQFVLGNRSLNFYLTALSAHASEMGGWLFMGYPLLIFTTGIFGSWAAIGLVVFMFLNWQFIAPKIRRITGEYNCLTLNAYFEKKFNDKTITIRTLSSIISLVFFITYIAAGLVGLGYLVETLFHINYLFGITIGFFIIILYVYIGGYNTVAWIDLVQGFFLLAVVLFIPIYLLPKIGGFESIYKALELKKMSTSLFGNFSFKKFIEIIFISCGWGLGYFGQPHIITKFMGIKNIKDMSKAKYLGMTWQALALGGATLIGLIGIVYFSNGLQNPEMVAVDIVQKTLHPILVGLVLCAILAATTNVIAAQVLVVASSMSEDLYKKLIRPKATHKELLKISRVSIVIVALISYIVAFFKPATIYKIVLYSWSGLGASFGPLLLLSLYTNKINKTGAIWGILLGAITAGLWPLIDSHINVISIPPVIVGFIISLIGIYLGTFLSKNKSNANI